MFKRQVCNYSATNYLLKCEMEDIFGASSVTEIHTSDAHPVCINSIEYCFMNRFDLPSFEKTSWAALRMTMHSYLHAKNPK